MKNMATEENELEKVAEHLKAHFVYNLSGQWARDGVDQFKDPYEWMQEYDSELGNRVQRFQSLFDESNDEDIKGNAVQIFLNYLDRFLKKAPKFPELIAFRQRILK